LLALPISTLPALTTELGWVGAWTVIRQSYVLLSGELSMGGLDPPIQLSTVAKRKLARDYRPIVPR
jgi:hypothetical protein